MALCGLVLQSKPTPACSARDMHEGAAQKLNLDIEELRGSLTCPRNHTSYFSKLAEGGSLANGHKLKASEDVSSVSAATSCTADNLLLAYSAP
jgi:hypothetical protein